MRVYYDTEFLEEVVGGVPTIWLISIGAIREDGKTYYAVNRDMPVDRIQKHAWLMENVWPYLPTIDVPPVGGNRPRGMIVKSTQRLNEAHSAVKSLDKIAGEVHTFFTADRRPPEMWAYYGAYDHVRLMWLWGRMIDRPSNIPMWTNDLRQEMHRLGISSEVSGFPEQEANLHKAIDDAVWNKRVHEYLMARAESMGRV
jgi:hypothetical protein